MDINDKIELVKEVGEEIIQEEELRELFSKKEKPIAYDGFEPSGKIHIAQGILRTINVNKLTKAGVHFKFYVADWFAMLNNKMGGDLDKIRDVGKYFIEVWKACGMDLDNVEFIWASEFIKENPDYWETVLKMSKNATINRVLRCGQIMGRDDSTSNPASQILYPLMQATDIFYLDVDIAQLGMDQRKVNMLARELAEDLGYKKPTAIHHHMLMGLTKPKETSDGSINSKIKMKMSKSNPDSAIFMTDSVEDVNRKIKDAYCPNGEVENNPIFEYLRYIIFEEYDELLIERPEKYGGNLKYKSYDKVCKDFKEGNLHPLDLKKSLAKYINKLLNPIREHFENNKEAKDLLDKVNSYKVSR
ncbi:MAG: tyrosine--tRNA ligase [Candidatus Woesearchaeota archaeon]